jgi:hypothetical protein
MLPVSPAQYGAVPFPEDAPPAVQLEFCMTHTVRVYYRDAVRDVDYLAWFPRMTNPNVKMGRN